MKGHAITSPLGDPNLAKSAEKAFRKKLVQQALQTLTEKVNEQLIQA